MEYFNGDYVFTYTYIKKGSYFILFIKGKENEGDSMANV